MKKVFIVTNGNNECWHDTVEQAQITKNAFDELELEIIEREISDEEYEEAMSNEFDGF